MDALGTLQFFHSNCRVKFRKLRSPLEFVDGEGSGDANRHLTHLHLGLAHFLNLFRCPGNMNRVFETSRQRGVLNFTQAA
jgi:hypothetical protein